jgi:hypothetical protein
MTDPRLTEDALEVLETFRLVRHDGTTVRALPPLPVTRCS